MNLDLWIRDHALLGGFVGFGAPGAFFLATAAAGDTGFGFHHPIVYTLLTGVVGALLGGLWGLAQREIVRARPDGLGWAAILVAAPPAGFIWGLGSTLAAAPTAFEWTSGHWATPDAAFVFLGAMLGATIGGLVALALAVLYVPLRLTGASASVLVVPVVFLGIAAGPVGVGLVIAGLFGLDL